MVKVSTRYVEKRYPKSFVISSMDPLFATVCSRLPLKLVEQDDISADLVKAAEEGEVNDPTIAQDESPVV
jgi:hypothetical protein